MQFLKEGGDKKNYKIILQNDNVNDINEYEKIFLSSLTYNFDKLKNRLQHITFIYEYETLLNLPELTKHIEHAVQKNGRAIDTLYNYSNIFHFRKSNFHFSQLHYNLFLKVLAAYEKINKTNSYFRGELPLPTSDLPANKKNISRGHFQIHVNKIDVPPILIKGKVCPVTGRTSTETNIFIIACVTKLNISPNAINPPKKLSDLIEILIL